MRVLEKVWKGVLCVLCCGVGCAVLCRRRRHGWGRTMGQAAGGRTTTPLGTPNSNPELEPQTRIPNSNSQPPVDRWRSSLPLRFVFSPQPLPSGEVAMAPEPDFKGLGADHQKGYFLPGRVHASASMGTDRAFSSLALCFVTHQVCRGDGEEDGKDQRKALLPYCIAFISTELFRGKLRFLREFASAFAKERKGNGDRKRER